MNYDEFLQSKRHKGSEYGIQQYSLNTYLFDFQAYVTEYAIKKGRCAVFLDTGLGKTLIELDIAKNYAEQTNKRVLIITPLAVAFQFIREAEKFGIDDIEYSKNGVHSKKIVVCNYERIDKFNPEDFETVILDESSILKNFEGSIKNKITAFIKKTNYRFLFTATPSPNDYVELGTSSEALGYLGYTDMLSKFFTNNEKTIKPQDIGTQWVLKGHATEHFFEWISSWSISMRRPSDLGFSDKGFDLPPLYENDHIVKNKNNMVVDGQIMLINKIAKSRKEIMAENRATINERCQKALELAQDVTVYWVNYNPEADYIRKNDKEATEIKGRMQIEEKEEILDGFSQGHIKRLITKPSITCFGLNWQHCNHTTYFPTFSFEQYYQAVRRFLRYGQTKPVTVDRISSDGQKRIMDSIDQKARKASQLYEKLNKTVNQKHYESNNQFSKTIKTPSFL